MGSPGSLVSNGRRTHYTGTSQPFLLWFHEVDSIMCWPRVIIQFTKLINTGGDLLTASAQLCHLQFKLQQDSKVQDTENRRQVMIYCFGESAEFVEGVWGRRLGLFSHLCFMPALKTTARTKETLELLWELAHLFLFKKKKKKRTLMHPPMK